MVKINDYKILHGSSWYDVYLLRNGLEAYMCHFKTLLDAIKYCNSMLHWSGLCDLGFWYPDDYFKEKESRSLNVKCVDRQLMFDFV